MKCLILSLLLGSLASLAGAQTAAQPVLDHSAPVLGRTLDLSIDQASPDALVRLLRSSAAGATQTPHGTLELDAGDLHIVATGRTDAGGRIKFGFPLALDADLAETEAHYQALVRDASTPTGWTTSSALHLRLAGPRVYAAFAGGVHPGGLLAVSCIDDSRVFSVQFSTSTHADMRLGDGKPIFDERLSHGAVMSRDSELVIFDASFGDVVARLQFQEASTRILTDVGTRHVLVLETGLHAVPPAEGIVHAVDFQSGALVASLPLGDHAPGAWVSDDEGRDAYVGVLDGDTGRTKLRRIRLDPLKLLRASRLGQDGGNTELMLVEYAAGQVFAGTRGPLVPYQPAYSWVTRLRYGPGVGPPSVDLVSSLDVRHVAALPGCDLLLIWTFDTWNGWSNGYEAVPLSAPGAPFSVPGPLAHLGATEAEGQDLGAWILDPSGNEPPNGDDLGKLWFLDLSDPSSPTWSHYPTTWYEVGPAAMALVRDLLVDRIYVACREFLPAPGFEVRPTLLSIDQTTGVERARGLGPQPYMLHAETVP